MTDEELRELGAAFIRKQLGRTKHNAGNAATQQSKQEKRQAKLQREQAHAHNLTPEDELDYVTNNGGMDAALKSAPSKGQSFEAYRNERRIMSPDYAYSSGAAQEGFDKGYFKDWYQQIRKSDPEYAAGLIDNSFVNAKNAEIARDQQRATAIALRPRPEAEKYAKKMLGENASVQDKANLYMELSQDDRKTFNRLAKASAEDQDGLLRVVSSKVSNQFAGLAQGRATAHRAEGTAARGGYSKASLGENTKLLKEHSPEARNLIAKQAGLESGVFDYDYSLSATPYEMERAFKEGAEQIYKNDPQNFNRLVAEARENAAQSEESNAAQWGKLDFSTEPPMITSDSSLWSRAKNRIGEAVGTGAYNLSKLIENYVTEEAVALAMGGLAGLLTGGTGTAGGYGIGKALGKVAGAFVSGHSEALDNLGEQYQTAYDNAINQGMSQDEAERFAYEAMHKSEKYQTLVTGASNLLNEFVFDNATKVLPASFMARPTGKVTGAILDTVASNIGEGSQEILQAMATNAMAGKEQWIDDQALEEGKSAFWSGLITAPIRAGAGYVSNKMQNRMSNVPNTTFRQDAADILGDIKNLGSDIKQYGYQFTDSIHTAKDPSYGVHHQDRAQDIALETMRAGMADQLVAAGLSKDRANDLARATKLIAMNLEGTVNAQDIFNSAYKVASDREGNPTTGPLKTGGKGSILFDQEGNVSTNWLGQIQRQPEAKTGHYTPETQTAESYGPMQIATAVHEGMGHHIWTQIENAAANGNAQAQELIKQAAEGRGYSFEQWLQSYNEDLTKGAGESPVRRIIQEDMASGLEEYFMRGHAPEGISNQQQAILNNIKDAFYDSPMYHGSLYNMTPNYGLTDKGNLTNALGRGRVELPLNTNAKQVLDIYFGGQNPAQAQVNQVSQTRQQTQQGNAIIPPIGQNTGQAGQSSRSDFDNLVRNGFSGLGNVDANEIFNPVAKANENPVRQTQQSGGAAQSNSVNITTNNKGRNESGNETVKERAERIKKKHQAKQKAIREQVSANPPEHIPVNPKARRDEEHKRLDRYLNDNTPVTKYLDATMKDGDSIDFGHSTTLSRMSGRYVIDTKRGSPVARKLLQDYETQSLEDGIARFLLPEYGRWLEDGLNTVLKDRSGMPESVQKAASERDKVRERDRELFNENQQEVLGNMDTDSTPIGDYIQHRAGLYGTNRKTQLDPGTFVEYDRPSDGLTVQVTDRSKLTQRQREMLDSKYQARREGSKDNGNEILYYYIGERRSPEAEETLYSLTNGGRKLPKYVRERAAKWHGLRLDAEAQEQQTDVQEKAAQGNKTEDSGNNREPVRPVESKSGGKESASQEVSHKEKSEKASEKTDSESSTPLYDAVRQELEKSDRPFSLGKYGYPGLALNLIKLNERGRQLTPKHWNQQGTYRLMLTGQSINGSNGWQELTQSPFFERKTVSFGNGKSNGQQLVKLGMEERLLGWLEKTVAGDISSVYHIKAYDKYSDDELFSEQERLSQARERVESQVMYANRARDKDKVRELDRELSELDAELRSRYGTEDRQADLEFEIEQHERFAAEWESNGKTGMAELEAVFIA